MNEQVAFALIDVELRRLQELSYSGLSALIGRVVTKERKAGRTRRALAHEHSSRDARNNLHGRGLLRYRHSRWGFYKRPTETDF